MSSLNFELEEEFDPIALGFEIPISPPSRVQEITIPPEPTHSIYHERLLSSPTQPRPCSPRPSISARMLSGRYHSADWAPDEGQTRIEAAHHIEIENGNGASGSSDEQDVVTPLTKVSTLPATPTDIVGSVSVGGENNLAIKCETGFPPGEVELSIPSSGASVAGQDGVGIKGETDLPSYKAEPSSPQNQAEGSSVTSTRIDIQSPRRKRKTFIAKLIRVPRSGHPTRPGIRITRLSSSSQSRTTSTPPDLVPKAANPSHTPTSPEPTPPLPPGFLRDLTTTFTPTTLHQIETSSKSNANTGDQLPIVLRDLFPLLSEPHSAVNTINLVRRNFNLPNLVVGKSNRIGVKRAMAQMRERLYIELVAALVVPLAPVAEETDAEEEVEKGERKDLSLTPVNLGRMGKMLIRAFPKEREAVRGVFSSGTGITIGTEGDGEEEGRGNGMGRVPALNGVQEGRVVWEGGVGRMVGTDGGFRGKVGEGGAVHVFVDHSNILYGLLHYLQPSSSTSLPPRHLRTLSLPCLSLLLRRGRYTPPGTLHLVASSPLKQDLDPLVRLGWEVSVLKRVEIYEDEVEDLNAVKLAPKAVAGRVTGGGSGLGGGMGLSGRVGAGGGGGGGGGEGGLRRYKEQGVDEILHLKILQALNSRDEPGRIVLATGDARGGQFNRDGFLGAVREAVKRGWEVELWSFRSGLSRAWFDVGKRERWFAEGKFRVHIMDEWAEVLVEVSKGDG